MLRCCHHQEMTLGAAEANAMANNAMGQLHGTAGLAHGGTYVLVDYPCTSIPGLVHYHCPVVTTALRRLQLDCPGIPLKDEDEPSMLRATELWLCRQTTATPSRISPQLSMHLDNRLLHHVRTALRFTHSFLSLSPSSSTVGSRSSDMPAYRSRSRRCRSRIFATATVPHRLCRKY